MYLMVLGASRLVKAFRRAYGYGLNAPDGAGCFPTPSACCPLSRLGKRAPDRHRPESAPWTGSHIAH